MLKLKAVFCQPGYLTWSVSRNGVAGSFVSSCDRESRGNEKVGEDCSRPGHQTRKVSLCDITAWIQVALLINYGKLQQNASSSTSSHY